MDKIFFLVYCMGNSGGSHLARCCQAHPNIWAWEEVHKKLGLDTIINPPNVADACRRRDKAMIKLLQKWAKRRPERSLGLIKSFAEDTVRFCLKRQGRVIQLFRHPIKVLASKLGRKEMEAARILEHKIKSDRDMFLGHVLCYKIRYQRYIARSNEFPLIRLEDLAISLLGDGRYYKETLEYLTQVEWADKMIDKVRMKIMPRIAKKDYRSKMGIKRCYPDVYQEDYSYRLIWEDWDDWQRSVFRKHFDEIMERLEYLYE